MVSAGFQTGANPYRVATWPGFHTQFFASNAADFGTSIGSTRVFGPPKSVSVVTW
jgi:hypothetical protein